MIVLQVKDLKKSFGVQNVFDNISFTLEDGEKVGLIGPNGTGKSTLLKCLTGEEIPDTGEIFVNERTSFGFLSQDSTWSKDASLFDELLSGFGKIIEDRRTLRELELSMTQARGKELEELMSRYALVTERYERSGGYGCENQVRRVAKGLGFQDDEFAQSVETMSGGQKTRAALARVLLSEPDILLLDEPTNHLDISAVEWLEEFISQYSKTVLVVSHDRYFLDRTVNCILEIDRGRVDSYRENYQGYLRRKADNMESYRRAYEKQQQMIAKTEEFIRRYKAGVKSKQARGRETLLARVERMEKPITRQTMNARDLAPVPECGYSVLEVSDLSHRYGEREIFSGLNFNITRGERVALLGDNGTGKSTILKSLVGEIIPSQGRVKTGPRVKTAYFSQEHETLDLNSTVLGEIMYSFNKGEEEARTLLGSILFQGDEVEKKISSLSGGERARLALLKLLLVGANFLVLDEPTNHLDIPSKEIVEGYLADFSGTILVVSHDRYFLDKVADRILELSEGVLTNYLGNYSYYRFKKKEALTSEIKEQAKKEGDSRIQNPSRQQERALKKITGEIQVVEQTLEKLEAEKEEMAKRLGDPASYEDGTEAKALVVRYEQLEEEISQVYARWEKLILEQEELQKSREEKVNYPSV
ncbi:MAG: ABC-F family ATP-binding cassette domain-containing protein [Desulfitobacteriaceae bacterium]|nr:ABC-F family ATP-binding cassette domain-containing protein [Desulfitobacteriaceae bacterium]MDD4752461.1 ABC-F family ATP-binding cassette domain-containing protein [Desulfitobacteriaceae bacterium]